MPLSLLLAAAVAQAAAPACEKPVPLPPELVGWVRGAPVAAGAAATEAATLVLNKGVRVLLRPGARVTPSPSRPSASGGVLVFEAPAAGRYRVALGRGAWVDLARSGRVLPSAAHGHGPACSRIRKMVDFDLTAGRYLLVLGDAKADPVPVLVSRLR